MRHYSTALILTLSLIGSPAGATAATTDLDIEAPDGANLKATHHSPGKPGPGVLLFHMCNSDRTAWTGLAELLVDRGIHVLALDYRGYGDSDGDRDEQGIRQLWPADIDAVLAAFKARPGVDASRLGAGGGSCGVGESVGLAGRHPGQIKALALLAGVAGNDDHEFLAASPWLPLLGVASHDDGQALPLMRWTLGFSSHEANRMLEYERGGHGTELFAVHAELEPAVADWFVEHLVTNPVVVPDVVKPRPGPSAAAWAAFQEDGGAARYTKRLHAARAAGQDLVIPPEGAINLAGYDRLGAEDVEAALEIFRFNVEAYPGSANALDSLGDAYLAAGDAERAAEYARRTLEAIPGDDGITEAFAATLREAAQAKLASPKPE